MFTEVDRSVSITQGDVVANVTVLASQWFDDEQVWKTVESLERVIVLTQACDLAESKTSRVLVALVHDARKLVDRGLVKPKTVEDQIRKHKIYGWYFLPGNANLPESLVDLRAVHTVPLRMLADLAAEGRRIRRICRLITPYREHLAQHFSVTYSRIGLPEPYETE